MSRAKPEIVDSLWQALNEPVPRCFVHSEQSRVTRMVEGLWVDRIDVGDLLEDWDSRLRGIDIFALAQALDLPARTIFSVSGRKTQRDFMGTEKLSRAYAAALMIEVERLGFRVDPSEMVKATLPLIQGVRYATSGELTVLCFAWERHKTRKTMSRTATDGRPTDIKEIRTEAGYKVTATLDENNRVMNLTVIAPRFRRLPEPVLTTCPDCGMTYMRGSPDDSASHRQTHRKHMVIADPRPNPKAAAAVAAGWDGRVDLSSPKWMHKEVYGRARLFRREFHYDFVQWSSGGEYDCERRSESAHKRR